DGTLVVEMADLEHPDRKFEPVRIEPEVLKQFRNNDLFGEGYTVVIPFWDFEKYRDVREVSFKMAFVPKSGGTAIYADPSKVTLNGQGDMPGIKQVKNTSVK